MDHQQPTFTIDGSRLTPVVSGPELFRSLIDLIEGAKTSLRLLYYIFEEDRSGTEVRDALVKAVERGAKVTLIVDGFGSDLSPQFLAPLDQAGAHTCRFLPTFGRRYLLRNHQKMAIADEQTLLIGGFNIEDSYFTDDADGWRDLGLMVDGPAAHKLSGYYDALWGWSQQEHSRMRQLRRTLGHWSQSNGSVRWLIGGPTRRLNPWTRAMKSDLVRARRFDMISAYFAPNPAMMRRIERVAGRDGAQMITAGRSDNDATIAAARHCYTRMLKRGVRIWEYRRQRLHTKLLIIDDAVYVGSANFDMRSLFLNLEVMLRVEDRAFADHMRRFMKGEQASSDEITRVDHQRNATWSRKLRWGIAYFIVAVMDSQITRRISFGTATNPVD